MVIYNTVLLLLFIPSLLVFMVVYRRRLRGEFFYRWKERLGIWELPAETGDARPLLWVHCASLGEVRAVEPLLKELKEYRILLTTLTLSGRAYAEKNTPAAMVFFLPLDFGFLVRKVFRACRPAGLVLIETELWPGLLYEAKRAGVPVLLANARMSPHSFGYYRLMKGFWRGVLEGVGRMAARSAEDADRFIALGYPAGRVTVTGNIKYDRSYPVPDATAAGLGIPAGSPVLVAGSTRDGEERILLDVWNRVKKDYPGLVLVIAPRHLNRVPDIIRELRSRDVAYSVWSARSDKPFECLLVDTFGELQKFYAIADIAYVGGSLVDRGGQNPIEPAAYAKPVLFGPSMSNFLTEANLLEQAGGGFRVGSADELTATLKKLLADPGLRRGSGLKAARCVESQKGALARTAAIVRSEVRPGSGT